MDLILFLKAALIGLSIAAPVGPIGLLCIQRTLTHGARLGFVSGLGAAAADGVYGAIGAFGLSTVMQTFVALATPLALGGAVFLGWMGIRLLGATEGGLPAAAPDAVSARRAFATVFALTLTNPLTILSFIAVFSALAGGQVATPGAAALMVFGVIAGSALWWLSLAIGVASLRHKIGPAVRRAINRAAGAFLLALAAWQLLALLL